MKCKRALNAPRALRLTLAGALTLGSTGCLAEYGGEHTFDDDPLESLGSVRQAASKKPDPAKFPSRDVGHVDVRCQFVSFIVSLNDDDDNKNGKPDLSAKRLGKKEDNLRELRFNHPGADSVYISAPYIEATGDSAVGKFVRAYSDRKGTPFDFSNFHALGAGQSVALFLEGIRSSTAVHEMVFEYQYNKGQTSICGPGGKGTVVDVNGALVVSKSGEGTHKKGSGGSFKTKRKMLITGVGQATGSVTPTMPTTWTYDGVAALGTPGALSTTFTAGTTFTPVDLRDQHLLKLAVSDGPQRVEAHFPVNVTAPRHVSTKSRGFTGVSPDANPDKHSRHWLDSNKGKFKLFKKKIRYKILDQWREPITGSSYAGRMPQIRENIGQVMNSPIAAVQAWVDSATGLNWTQAWKDKPRGKFTDKIEALSLNRNLIVTTRQGGQRVFHRELRDATGSGTLFQLGATGNATHRWYLSVNGEGEVSATANTFQVTVAGRLAAGGDVKIKLRSEYVVHLN